MAEGFEWDRVNIRHIWRHRVRPHEAEEAMQDPHVVPLPASDVSGIPREAVLGLTEAVRLLWVLYEPREDGYRVITARNADTHEERLYWSQR
jgi:uncharacterized DUF497 family protein